MGENFDRSLKSASRKVQCSHNNLCICRKYRSPINLSTLIPLLDIYPDKKLAAILKSGFSEGFKLGYEGERVSRDAPNLKSVSQLHDKAIEKIDKEVKLGRIAGPFNGAPCPNLIISPIGIIPKSQPGKFIMIHHLSYPHGESVNDGINRSCCEVKYTSFDVAVAIVLREGKGAMMAKADIE